MDIKQIISLEKKNSGRVILHKEGIFWRAYEVSAWLFTEHVKAYSIKCRYYKNINTSVCYLGFPNSTLDAMLKSLQGKEVDKNGSQIVIDGFVTDLSGYEKWKAECNYQNKSNMRDDKDEEIIERIRAFNIANSSPMQCQNFLLELQNCINGIFKLKWYNLTYAIKFSEGKVSVSTAVKSPICAIK